jgi:hypothetical protein
MTVSDVCVNAIRSMGYDPTHFLRSVETMPDWCRANLARESDDPEGDARRLKADVSWLVTEAALDPAPLLADPRGIRPARPRPRGRGRRPI